MAPTTASTQHLSNLFPLPHGHGSLAPNLSLVTLVSATLASPPYESVAFAFASLLFPGRSASRSSISRRSLTWSTASPSRRICSTRCLSWAWARKSVAIRPPNPAPSPARIGVQPVAEQCCGFTRLAQFEIRLRHCAPPVLGQKIIFRRKTPQPLFAHGDPAVRN